MTQRERQTSGGVFEVAPPLAAGPPGLPPAANGSSSGSALPVWEDVFAAAATDQQRELLALARQQGVLYAHQLPPLAGNGARPDSNRQVLARLLAGLQARGGPATPVVRELDPVLVHQVPVMDPALDDCQREAVARALHTPDVCLIQGLPGTGKSRVVAEILAQAANRGERVLLLAPHATAIDRALELVASRDIVFPIRCLGRTEALERLPLASRTATLTERQRRLQEHTLPLAREDVTAAAQKHRRLLQDEPLWARLLELASWSAQLETQCADLQATRARIEEDVAREAVDPASSAKTAFGTALQAAAQVHEEFQARCEHDLAKVRTRSAEQRQQQEQWTAQFRALRPLADAKEHHRWWSGDWWRATFKGDVLTQVGELQARQQEIEAALEALKAGSSNLEEEKRQEQQRFEAECARLREAECGRRKSLLDEQEAGLKHEQRVLQEKWQTAWQDLQPETRDRWGAGKEITCKAVNEASGAWQEQLRKTSLQEEFASQWVACLEETAADFPNRLLGLCNLVAATTEALPNDEHFGEARASSRPAVVFDLLVLDEADQVTESEFLNLARRARRWVLVGQPVVLPEEPLAPNRLPAAARAARPSALRPGFFQRLFDALHCDPRHLPSSWIQDKGRLRCQLRQVSPEQSQWLETERVADFPDIELRILAMPRCEPLLAEVVFPCSMSIVQAKEYIFRELQAVPVRAHTSCLRWEETSDRLVLHLADRSDEEGTAVPLEPGVREMLCSSGGTNGLAAGARAVSGNERVSWQTCCIEFDRAAGWHRQRAGEWVRQYLGLHDLGRTARLDVCYRMRPDLAAFVADLLFADGYRMGVGPGLVTLPALSGAAVEFVPVPPLRDDSHRSGRGVVAGQRGGHSRGHSPSRTAVAAAPLPRKGGAGLELDLTDTRHRDRLPTELRGGLPDRGFVNYLEAQTVLRALEALLADPAVRALAAHSPGEAVIGVLALYPGQAELMRRLLQQSPALVAAGNEVRVEDPTACREREFPIVLLSLTRSHTHRAVSYGEGPATLALALTRARRKLILFGDAGTLARRCQWESTLDHLDETTSARERDLLRRLLAYIQGQGPLPCTFQLREGSSA
jgi:hypothetical protein